MKTLIHSAQNLPRLISNPLNVTALPLFFALAFLPSILRLAWYDFPAANPATALGPVIAGFWLAAGIREIRVSLVLLGPFLTTLIYAINWLMLAGHGCCSTMN
jgi:hypothetical protein